MPVSESRTAPNVGAFAVVGCVVRLFTVGSAALTPVGLALGRHKMQRAAGVPDLGAEKGALLARGHGATPPGSVRDSLGASFLPPGAPPPLCSRAF